MLKDGIPVAEQSVTEQPKLSRNMQHYTLILTVLDEWSEGPDPINRLVMLSHTINTIVLTIFFKLLLWLTSIQPYHILKVLKPLNFVQTNN